MYILTQNLEGRLVFPELCYQVLFPRGPLLVTDLLLSNFIHPKQFKIKLNLLHVGCRVVTDSCPLRKNNIGMVLVKINK